MWPTVDGLRVLKDAEAELVRDAVGVMVVRLVAEHVENEEPRIYGIDWFDQWECDQRIWLLETIAFALLSDDAAPQPAAIWEATIDVIFREVLEQISDSANQTAWRVRALDAFQCHRGRAADIAYDEPDVVLWRRLISQIADAILGAACYQKAESLRDGDIGLSRQFLQQKGLPQDYLERIPPLRSAEQTRLSLRRLRAIISV